MNTRDLTTAWWYARRAGIAEAMRQRSAAEDAAAADRARLQDVDFLTDGLRQIVAAAPDRFAWLDPRPAARLLVEKLRP
jgi:hypothetical protein